MGYFEYFTGLRLTPNFQGGEIITYDWRATALFGHPLSNALLTGTYLLVITGAGGRRFGMPRAHLPDRLQPRRHGGLWRPGRDRRSCSGCSRLRGSSAGIRRSGRPAFLAAAPP